MGLLEILGILIFGAMGLALFGAVIAEDIESARKFFSGEGKHSSDSSADVPRGDR